MFKVRLINLPGFKLMNQYPLEQQFFENKTAIELYSEFKATLHSAINKRFFPVMRMCDGEYIYCVGKQRPIQLRTIDILRFYINKFFKKQVTVWGESYTSVENNVLKKNFPYLLKVISEYGIIANHYVHSHTHFCEEYIYPMRKWYIKNGIDFNKNNFTSFYFVYILLNGPDSLEIFKGKSILILSSFDANKCLAVEKEIKRRGASTIYFESISKTQSMLDKLDLGKYKNSVDLVLIAAGIGSANILLQCKILNTVCIDAGFCLDCIADPAKRTERIFCLPDEPF